MFPFLSEFLCGKTILRLLGEHFPDIISKFSFFLVFLKLDHRWLDFPYPAKRQKFTRNWINYKHTRSFRLQNNYNLYGIFKKKKKSFSVVEKKNPPKPCFTYENIIIVFWHSIGGKTSNTFIYRGWAVFANDCWIIVIHKRYCCEFFFFLILSVLNHRIN